MERELLRRQEGLSSSSRKERFLWQMIKENLISTFENELVWIEDVKNGIGKE